MLESGAPTEGALPKLKEAAAAAQPGALRRPRALVGQPDGAVRRAAAAVRRFLTADGALAVDDRGSVLVSIADEQIEVFRIVQEGLANVRKHAGRSAPRSGSGSGWAGIVSVSDDGVGFDGAEAAAGQGLKNMRLRAKTIDGGFNLRSIPGRGPHSRSCCAPKGAAAAASALVQICR